MEHSAKCLYANEVKPNSKMSICSVVSSGSVCSSMDDAPSTSLINYSTSQASDLSQKSSASKKPANVTYKNSRHYCCRRSESALLAEKHPDKIPVSLSNSFKRHI